MAAERKGVNLHLLPSPDPCVVRADPHLLSRALDNLLENGIRHTPSGGSVELGWRKDGGQVVIWVADTGEGLAPGASRTRQSGGAGMGLLIARRVTEAHGGSLTAENRLEGGACFTLILPEQA